jgi:hypothetical protein
MASPTAAPATIVLRLPRTAYLSVVLLLLGTVPLAFGADDYRSIRDVANGTGHGGGFTLGWRIAFLLIPVAVAIAIARTATIVDADGIRVRALLGTRRMHWDEIRGVSVNGRAIYAVLADGAVRLPCTRLAHLGVISRTSQGRLPELPDPVPKPAPARRSRR